MGEKEPMAMKTRFSLFILLALAMPIGANANDDDLTPSAEGAKVYFVSPEDGARLSSPVHIVFGLVGMGVIRRR